jgi:hypothetical protein
MFDARRSNHSCISLRGSTIHGASTFARAIEVARLEEDQFPLVENAIEDR